MDNTIFLKMLIEDFRFRQLRQILPICSEHVGRIIFVYAFAYILIFVRKTKDDVTGESGTTHGGKAGFKVVKEREVIAEHVILVAVESRYLLRQDALHLRPWSCPGGKTCQFKRLTLTRTIESRF